MRDAPASGDVTAKTVALVALGCSKNMVDSEMILGSLLERGWALTGDESEADMVVINTCGFIGDAREESVDAIVEALDSRTDGQKIVVSGCLSQRYGDELLQELPEIDALLGINAPRDIVEAVNGLWDDVALDAEASCNHVTPAERQYGASPGRFLLTPRHHAYLRIADGCDRGCRFCAIPRIRGRQRSRTLEDLVDEARTLAAQGCREINLVAHDLNAWGTDLPGESHLGDLIESLDAVDGLDWIRCFYLYPAGMTTEIISAMARARHVVPYIDMPLQHISDHVLGEMNRRVGRDETLRVLDAFREAMPEAAFRTTMLVGHPGEREEDFEELLTFVGDFRFTHLGAFAYSPEDGTAAARRPHQVPEGIGQQRRDRLMALQQSIVFEQQEARVGGRETVVIDGPAEDGRQLARSWREGPDSDPVIFVSGDQAPGTVMEVTITAREGYDLGARA